MIKIEESVRWKCAFKFTDKKRKIYYECKNKSEEERKWGIVIFELFLKKIYEFVYHCY